MKKHVILLLGLAGMLMIGTSVLAREKVVVIPMTVSKEVSNIVTVAKSGGDFTDLQKAIDSITDAASDNPYLIVIGPGIYRVEKTITMKPFVDITGSGPNITMLIGQIGTSSMETSAIIRCFPSTVTTLSNIEVINSGNEQSQTKFSVAIHCENHAYMILENVIVGAAAGPHGADFIRAVYNLNNSFISLENGVLIANGTNAVALFNSDDSQSRVNNSRLLSEGSGSSGVRVGNSATRIINTEIHDGVIDAPSGKQCIYTYDPNLNEVNC